MTLDEYRGTLIESLRACQDTTEARDLLAEANLVLANTKMSRVTQDRFWETLEEELDVAGADLTLFKDSKAAVTFAAVVAAARARIARYRAQPEGESSSTGQVASAPWSVYLNHKLGSKSPGSLSFSLVEVSLRFLGSRRMRIDASCSAVFRGLSANGCSPAVVIESPLLYLGSSRR